MSDIFNKIFTNNLRYKVVSLFVAIVLWVTLTGRRDFVISHDISLQILLAPTHFLANDPPETIKVELSGPNSSLKKIRESNEFLSLDLTKLNIGRQIIKVSSDSLQLPLGVKVISLNPSKLNIHIKKAKEQTIGN